MELVTIRELKQRAQAEPGGYRIHAQVESVLEKTTRTGNPFYEVRLADAEDHLALKAWSDSPEFEKAGRAQARSFVEVSGDWEDKGKYGLEARNWELRLLEGEDVEALLGGGAELQARQSQDYAFIMGEIGSLNDPRLRGMGLAFLEKFGERFRRAGAAREYHHARRGGLVEHVAQMMRLAGAVAGAYPALNRDLLLAGVLFHDCGKLWENCYEESGFVMPYSEAGEMLGHIAIGMEMVNKLWHALVESEDAKGWVGMEPSNDEVRLHLMHLVASHHGQKDFGSPVVPGTPEAMALHYIDNMDAKLEMFAKGYESAAELGRNIQERVYPLPGKLVKPLGKVGGETGLDADGVSQGDTPE